MAKDAEPAGIGGDRTTDRGAGAAREVHPVGPPRGCRCLLDSNDRYPGTRRQLAGSRIDVIDAAQPPKTEHRLAAEGDRAADEAGVPSLHRQPDAVPAASAHDRRDLLRRPGTDDAAAPAPKTAREVDDVTREQVLIDEDVLVAHDLAQLPQLPGFDHDPQASPVGPRTDPIRIERAVEAR